MLLEVYFVEEGVEGACPSALARPRSPLPAFAAIRNASKGNYRTLRRNIIYTMGATLRACFPRACGVHLRRHLPAPQKDLIIPPRAPIKTAYQANDACTKRHLFWRH